MSGLWSDTVYRSDGRSEAGNDRYRRTTVNSRPRADRTRSNNSVSKQSNSTVRAPTTLGSDRGSGRRPGGVAARRGRSSGGFVRRFEGSKRCGTSSPRPDRPAGRPSDAPVRLDRRGPSRTNGSVTVPAWIAAVAGAGDTHTPSRGDDRTTRTTVSAPLVAQSQFHADASSWMLTFFACVCSYSSSIQWSRPMPLCLNPPNGVPM